MNEKRASSLFWAVKALLAVVLVYAVFETTTKPLHLRKAFKPHAVAGDDQTATAPFASSEHRPPADVSRIIANNPFTGPDTQSAAPASPSDTRAPGAAASIGEELGLRLVGTVAGGPTTSRAVIQDAATKSTRPYKIGDIVASATILSIESDAVVLLHQGREKTLSLSPGAARTGVADPGQAQAARPTADYRPDGQAARPSSPKLGYVEDIFRKATIELHQKEGQTTGLKITGLENTPLSGMFGLRNGDVVQTVNGQDLTSKQKAFQVLQKARTQSQIRIQLLRNDQVKQLAFDLY